MRKFGIRINKLLENTNRVTHSWGFLGVGLAMLVATISLAKEFKPSTTPPWWAIPGLILGVMFSLIGLFLILLPLINNFSNKRYSGRKVLKEGITRKFDDMEEVVWDTGKREIKYNLPRVKLNLTSKLETKVITFKDNPIYPQLLETLKRGKTIVTEIPDSSMSQGLLSSTPQISVELKDKMNKWEDDVSSLLKPFKEWQDKFLVKTQPNKFQIMANIDMIGETFKLRVKKLEEILQPFV